MIALLLLASAAHAAETGVEISSATPGAIIWIDGAQTDLVAPARLTGLSPGDHIVEVRRECEADRRSIHLSAGEVATVALAPIVIGGALTVQVLPDEASIEVDGAIESLRSGQRKALSCGPHQLSLSADGFRPAFRSIAVQPFDELTWQVELEALGVGSLAVDLDPDTAGLWLDGVERPPGDQLIEGLVVGPHTLDARLAGYVDASSTVVVVEGARLDIRLALTSERTAKAAARPHPGRGAGLVLMGGGAVLGGVAAGLWALGQPDFHTYQDKVALVKEHKLSRAEADTYYDTEVQPHKTPIYATAGAAALLGVTGIAVASAF